MPALLELDGIEAGYGRFRVLHGLSIAVPAGAIVAVLGPNGAGKSTLMRVIGGLMQPSAGSVRFRGRDVTSRSGAERARLGICLVPEGRGIFPGLSVSENLALAAPTRALRGVRGLGAASAERVVDMFPILRDRLDQRAGSLSGGEQQMLAVARALLTDPSIVLFDEPSLGLAPMIVDALYDVIARMHAAGTTIVLVEQYVGRALAIAQLVVMLERGSVAFAGEPGELSEVDAGLDAYLGRAVRRDKTRGTKRTAF